VVSFAALSLLPPKQARAYGASRISLLVSMKEDGLSSMKERALSIRV
jgi:hypothetical protein